MQYHIRLYEAEGFQALEVPGVGRRLDVSGFVLAEPFDVLLRKLTTEYLQAAWESLSPVLARHNLLAGDLSYGWLHSGETSITGLTDTGTSRYVTVPSDFTGWTSCELSELWRDEKRCNILNQELLQCIPPICYGATWRSVKWKIHPEDYALALRLLKAMWTDEPSDWAPYVVLEGNVHANTLWGRIAAAIEQRDQTLLDHLMADARAQYSPAGHKIVLRGFASYITGSGPYLPTDIGDHLSLRLRGPSGHSNIYPDVEES